MFGNVDVPFQLHQLLQQAVLPFLQTLPNYIALIKLLNEYKQLIRCQLQLLLKMFCCTLPTAAHWENLPRDDTKISLINTGIPDKEQQRNERHLSLSLPPQS